MYFFSHIEDVNNYSSYGIGIIGTAVSADEIQTADAEDVSGEVKLSTHTSTSYGAYIDSMLTLFKMLCESAAELDSINNIITLNI